ncbi:hypothetical protein AB0K12_23925 [Nonomuraea sp. NPDC049419]|uniref:hypothetical protein n=1 Tax=Nonomuraea sp. NPDC049419 TaxID=3155772 RepID=UPI0034172331
MGDAPRRGIAQEGNLRQDGGRELLRAAAAHGFPITPEELREVVAANDTRRYTIEGDRITMRPGSWRRCRARYLETRISRRSSINGHAARSQASSASRFRRCERSQGTEDAFDLAPRIAATFGVTPFTPAGDMEVRGAGVLSGARSP